MKLQLLPLMRLGLCVACGCGQTDADQCAQTYHVVCERIFECDPEGGASLWQTEANCETQTLQTVGCGTTPVCEGRGTFQSNNAESCKSAYTNATCDQIVHNGFDVKSCSRLCE